jgi:hypothetical protein
LARDRAGATPGMDFHLDRLAVGVRSWFAVQPVFALPSGGKGNIGARGLQFGRLAI